MEDEEHLSPLWVLLFETVTKMKQMRTDPNKMLLIFSVSVLHKCDVECAFIMCAGV